MIARRILVVIPHPDDEVVGCAAAIGRARRDGSELFGLYLTTGVPHVDALWPWQRRRHPALVARRRREAEAAAAQLGLTALGFAARPSRSLKDHVDAAAAEVTAAIDRCAAECLWVPAWEGAHQDHDAANFIASRLAARLPVFEFAEYNFAGGTARSQLFPCENGTETILRLSTAEQEAKRRLLAIYRSERGNLAHIGTERESFRVLPRHDYAAAPHDGTLFRERFHWVPFRHPRIDFEASAHIRAILSRSRL